MKFRILAVASIIVLAFTAFFTQYSISQTPRPWRSFIFTDVPAEINAAPGETVTIKGGVLNNGWYWLGDFRLSLSGLPDGYNYTITPNYLEDLMILREWNPQQGVYRVPQNFTLSIKVPNEGFGVHILNMTGQESRSWYKFSNSTVILLKVSSTPKFTLSDIVIPETVAQYKPFNLTFTVNNEGEGSGTLNIAIDAPQDWDVSARNLVVSLDPGASQPVVVTVTPTNTSGNLNILAGYPYKETIVNITQVGPYLTPSPVEMPSEGVPSSGFAAVVEFVKGLGPIVFGIGVILLIIIIWNILGIYKGYKS